MLDQIVLCILLFVGGLWVLLCLADSGTQYYCRCREPRRDDEDLYPDLYPEYKDNVSEVNQK